jgi:hypothetical protein
MINVKEFSILRKLNLLPGKMAFPKLQFSEPETPGPVSFWPG